ncbi:PREDICTED: uncharacterized protein LOC108760123 isoform X1 [Trachymyrmex cornetzi]|uniref:uncharacterized protein LOC108760123 isoform X1 n=1 Tax=Trachymyrmex cornetzi TaxID=471704 RepID=UPI00084EDA84|nr:PREDICTED: uncharacterized protein LOC108760123 isoform X1 [Trachymyrmex cornetzi]
MDWRNEESDQSSVENLKWDENDHPAERTKDAVAAAVLDHNVCSQGIQVGIGTCKDIGNFTSALESLELETTNHPGFRTNYMQTDYFNDSEQEETVPVFKTREKSTFELVVQGPEILIFQERIEERIYPAGHPAFPCRYRTLLEEGFSDVAVEIGPAREEAEKYQSKGCFCKHFVSRESFVAYTFI